MELSPRSTGLGRCDRGLLGLAHRQRSRWRDSRCGFSPNLIVGVIASPRMMIRSLVGTVVGGGLLRIALIGAIVSALISFHRDLLS